MAVSKLSRFTDRILAAMRRGRIAGAMAAALSAGAMAAWAQDPAADGGVNRTFLNKSSIDLPIEIENSYRSQISNLVLYVKEGANGTWAARDKAAPTQTSFTFRAPRDGEYWFRIVAIDKQGNAHPDDLSKDPQDAVVVIIDTTMPGLDVAHRAAAAEGQIIQCDIRDANPDIFKLRFYYQTRDQVWRSLESLPDQPNLFCVPSQAALTNFIRVVACDMAGNSTARTYSLSELAAKGAPGRGNIAAGPQAPSAPRAIAPPPGGISLPSPNTSPLPVTIVNESGQPIAPPTIIEQGYSEPRTPAPQPINSTIRTAKTNLPTPGSGPTIDVLPEVRPGTVELPPVPQAPEIETVSGTMSKQAPMPAAQLVGSHQVFLNYAVENVGGSGVGKLEIYATRDRGQTWHKIGEDSTRKNPVEVNLPGEGLFGLKAVVSNGRGFGAGLPQAGDPADWWIEVDTTRPKAAITGIRAGVAQEAGAIYIYWQTEDKNIIADSAELFYAPSREGPWTSMARNLKNSGEHRWQPPAEAGAHAFIRLIVRDKAGNIGLSETTQPVPLDDLSRPRVRLIGVTAPQTLNSSIAQPGLIQPVQATSTPIDGGGIRPATFTAPTTGAPVSLPPARGDVK